MERKHNPLLTVGIPTWNRAAYLAEGVDSLIAEIEKHRLHDEIEILVSDNASEDRTQAIAQERTERFSYVRYLRNDRNRGVKYNILQVMRMAEGKYFMMLGDDDRIVDGSLAKIVEKLRGSDAVTAMFVQQAGHNYAFPDIDKDTFLSFEEIFSRYFYNIGNAGVFIINTASTRSVIDEYGIEFFSETWPQTQVLCLSLAAEKRPSVVTTIKAVDSNLHTALSVYSGYYLWRTAFADLLSAARDLRPMLGEEFWQVVSRSLYPRMSGIVNDVLFYSSLVDTEEQRRKTAVSIRHLIPLLPWSLRFKALILWMHVGLPRSLMSPFYRARILLRYGRSVIKTADERAGKEREKRELALRERAVRELV